MADIDPGKVRSLLTEPMVVVRRHGVAEFAPSLDARTVEVITRHLRAAWTELGAKPSAGRGRPAR